MTHSCEIADAIPRPAATSESAAGNALAAEHAPNGPTEEHLVEELAGIIWRKRRLRMAEAAVYREKLRKDASSNYEQGIW